MGSGLSGVAGIRVGRLASWNLEDRVWSLKVSGVQDHGFKVGCELSECKCRASSKKAGPLIPHRHAPKAAGCKPSSYVSPETS